MSPISAKLPDVWRAIIHSSFVLGRTNWPLKIMYLFIQQADFWHIYLVFACGDKILFTRNFAMWVYMYIDYI